MTKTRTKHPALTLLMTAAALISTVASAEVPTDPFQVQPLLVGSMAPAFEVRQADGSPYIFNPDQLEKNTIVLFYRGGWCPFCMLHWAELRKIEDELFDLGFDLIFMSADKPDILAEALKGEDQPRYHLLSDASMETAERFGVAFKVDDATITRYDSFGIDLQEASGYDHHVLPVPSLFMIGTDGIIKFQYVNPDYKIRLHPEVLLAAAKTMPDRSLRD